VILELHVIHNVAPANLNRDDTGAPKEAFFGGCRRARVSSQSWKRAIRRSFAPSFGKHELAWRTRRLVERTAETLAQRGRDPEQAGLVATKALRAAGAKVDEKTGQSAVLWLVAKGAVENLAKICEDHWDKLAVDRVPAETERAIRNLVATNVVGVPAVDIALFGRMLTDVPEGGTVEAAVQVAHAISTHAVDSEFDYFTAVDDLMPEDESGAGMLGTVEFNSACFYRYATLDTTQLVGNLVGNEELARRAASAFATSFVTVMPTGKQNTFAAHNPVSATVAITRLTGSWNLANAFVEPVRPGHSGNLVRLSCEALARYWDEVCQVYGNPASSMGLACEASLAETFSPLGLSPAPLAEVVDRAVEAALGGAGQ
jgi:CRISPR system Cascade subunit CasC